MKIPFLRDGPERTPRMINASILRSSFERRGLLIGAVQGGVGVLLARMRPVNSPSASVI